MKKLLIPFCVLLCCLLAKSGDAQTYAAWGNNPYGQPTYDTIHYNGDTLVFTFTGVPTGAWGTAHLVVYYEGDFGDVSEYLTAYGPGATNLGQTDFTGTDCVAEDSVVLPVTAANINSWASSITFRLVPSGNVDPFCTRNRAKVRLYFSYCSFGPPAEMARRNWSDSMACSLGGPIILHGEPAGGAFSGPGVTMDSIFDPVNLAPGFYTITYTATDSIGCETTDEGQMLVLPEPVPPASLSACPGDSVTITPTGGINFVWFADEALTTPLDTGESFTTPPLTETTSFWAAGLDVNHAKWSDSMVTANFSVVDHYATTGDDRGGIAVTQNYVYVMGDGSGARYNVNLGSVVSVPRRDGIFSDLRSGLLWSVWDTLTDSDPQAPLSGPFTMRAVKWLDSLANFGSRIIYLSQPITLATSGNGIFAGYGTVGIYSAATGDFYVIDLDNGYVTDLGAATLNMYPSESWASWGVLEQECDSTYSAVYHSTGDPNAVTRMQLPSGATSQVGSFPSGLSDLASLTQSSWNNRWYFHYEGSSGTFGGTNETVGYADATDTKVSCGSALLGCAARMEVTVDTTGPEGESICVVTVDSATQKNKIVWERITPNDPGGHYNIYRETTQSGVYALRRSWSDSLVTMWIDSTSNPLQSADRYKITVVDACGRESEMSDHHKTIHLTVSAGAGGSWNLIWSHYEGFNFLTYYIYRGYTPYTLTVIDSIQGNLNSYTDISPPGGTLYYAVKAVNPGSCNPTSRAAGSYSSLSNAYSPNAVGVDEQAPGQTLNIAPNPGDGLFNFSIEGCSGDVLVNVTDAAGRTVYAEKIENVNGPHFSTLDLRGTATGIYFVVLTTEKGELTRKLIVQ